MIYLFKKINELYTNGFLDFIIALGALIGIFISIYSLREMKKQRILNVKPHLILLRKILFRIDLDSNKKNEINNKDINKLDFQLRNIGNGMAKNILVKASIDDEYAKNITNIDISNNRVIFKMNNNMAYFYDNSCFKFSKHIQAIQVDKLDILFLYNIQMAITYTWASLDKGFFNTDNIQEVEIYTPNIEICIIYQDILGYKYECKYKISTKIKQIKLCPETDQTEEVNYDIYINTIKDNQKTNLLGKIFKNEVYFKPKKAT